MDILLLCFILLMFGCMCWFVYYIIKNNNQSTPIKPSLPSSPSPN